jgi:hypothetical protein
MFIAPELLQEQIQFRAPQGSYNNATRELWIARPGLY